MFNRYNKKPLTEKELQQQYDNEEAKKDIKEYLQRLKYKLTQETESINIATTTNQISILNKILNNEAISKDEHDQVVDIYFLKNNKIIHGYTNFHKSGLCNIL